jgi:hypothetical protein
MPAGDLGLGDATSNARRGGSRDGASGSPSRDGRLRVRQPSMPKRTRARPEDLVCALEPESFGPGPAENRELLAEGKVLQGQLAGGANQRAQGPEDRDKHGQHDGFCPARGLLPRILVPHQPGLRFWRGTAGRRGRRASEVTTGFSPHTRLGSRGPACHPPISALRRALKSPDGARRGVSGRILGDVRIFGRPAGRHVVDERPGHEGDDQRRDHGHEQEPLQERLHLA